MATSRTPSGMAAGSPGPRAVWSWDESARPGAHSAFEGNRPVRPASSLPKLISASPGPARGRGARSRPPSRPRTGRGPSPSRSSTTSSTRPPDIARRRSGRPGLSGPWVGIRAAWPRTSPGDSPSSQGGEVEDPDDQAARHPEQLAKAHLGRVATLEQDRPDHRQAAGHGVEAGEQLRWAARSAAPWRTGGRSRSARGAAPSSKALSSGAGEDEGADAAAFGGTRSGGHRGSIPDRWCGSKFDDRPDPSSVDRPPRRSSTAARPISDQRNRPSPSGRLRAVGPVGSKATGATSVGPRHSTETGDTRRGRGESAVSGLVEVPDSCAESRTAIESMTPSLSGLEQRPGPLRPVPLVTSSRSRGSTGLG